MKTEFKQIVTIFLSIFLLSCSSDETALENSTAPAPVLPPNTTTPIANSINYLALGDSYTIGQSVCETCRYPEQLKASLNAIYPQTSFSLKVIATTGWTTSNLLSAINTQNPKSDYDLVTLLIGVNNQYQGRDFSLYEKEFPELLNKAIELAKGNAKDVIVLSIPDYAYTPFGVSMMQGQTDKISSEINNYNSFAENYCKIKDVVFINITEITRQGLKNPDLVAKDVLHPSEYAYKLFVEKMLPAVKSTFRN
ncbi:SGNH/GDSL hydrolase family protein [Flavobacterium sp. 1355]|uniref:SGNH/GDSL hydrolase family protein n=1 Tax=Flavobacterium sp. 1355 TaxID=2806571 RepID=UPI001AE304D4|nr:SGNH/GDSL hydrolase family protein [Flavobacterium sp. 1355]MBP1225343.1 lysophospholipase L1-like esterase [Flavobacterium sp. 1355]